MLNTLFCPEAESKYKQLINNLTSKMNSFNKVYTFYINLYIQLHISIQNIS